MKSQLLKTPLPYLALIIAHLIWGGNFVVAKITLQEIPVMSLGFLRFSLAFLLLIPFLISIEPKKRQIKLETLPKLFLIGLLLVTFNIAFFYEGLIRTSAIDASSLTLIMPLVSVLAGWWILKEKVYLMNLMGITLGLLGAITVIGLPLIFFGSFNTANLVGNILILASCVCVVAGMIASKKMLKIYSPLFLTATMFLVGAITFFIPAFLEYLKNPNWIYHISILAILGLLYITVLSSITAYFLLVWALSKLDVYKVNLIQYMEPAVAASLAVPILGERISFSFIIGTCLVVLGVYWGTLGKQEHHHPYLKHHRV